MAADYYSVQYTDSGIAVCSAAAIGATDNWISATPSRLGPPIG
jgi:hypothetical protein